MGKKVLIIGGMAAGASAAARLRRLDETAEIIIFEKGEYISYASCGLPYYVGGVINERKKLLVQTPAAMKERFNIDVRTNQEALAIAPKLKTVTVKDHKAGTEYIEKYDSLLICTGATPFIPDLAGIDKKNIFLVRDIPDSDAVKGYIQANASRNAVIIGGGAIGLETAEMLCHLGLNVHIVDLADHVLPPFDADMASFIQAELKSHGVKLHLQTMAQAMYAEGDKVSQVQLDSGESLPADLVILSLGVRPASAIAKAAGLELGVTGGILVDEYLRTSDPSIWAAGDVIETTHIVSGKKIALSSAGPANRQGWVAVNNICGAHLPFKGVQGTFIVKVFGQTGSSTGLNESNLQRFGIPYECIHLAPASHATYYPGAATIFMKVLFDPADGRLLGAQFVGADGVDKRMDVFATALRANLTVFDLQDFELAYAPPYASAKDPINMIGYAAGNVVSGLVSMIQWKDVPAYLDKHKAILVDLRTTQEISKGVPEKSVHIPLDSLRDRLGELPRGHEILLCCQSGQRSYIGARILAQHGFKVKNVSGGYHLYKAMHG